MAKVVPFKGLRYNTEKFKDLDMVTAPPYDIISAEEQQELYNKDEYNVIRLDYGMEFESDDSDNNKYTRSAAYLNKWKTNRRFISMSRFFSLILKNPLHIR